MHGAGRAEGAGGEQQAVARQKGHDDEPGLDEDDRKQQQVDPGAVVLHERDQMAVDVQDEIDQGHHGGALSCG